MPYLCKVVKAVLFVLLSLLIIATALQVISRYILAHPFIWTQDFVRLTFTWLIMLSLPVAYYQKSLSSLDYFVNKYFAAKKRVLAIIDLISIISNLMVFGFAFIMTVYGYQLSKNVIGQVIPGLSISTTFKYLAMPVSGFLLLCVCLDRLISKIKDLTRINKDSI